MCQFRFSVCASIGILLTASGLFAQTSSSTKKVSLVRTTKFTPGKPASAPISNTVLGPDVDESFDIPGISGNNSPARLPANFVPRPAGNPFASATFNGFVGLDQFQQAVAFTGVPGGDNGQLEPPDQAGAGRRRTIASCELERSSTGATKVVTVGRVSLDFARQSVPG